MRLGATIPLGAPGVFEQPPASSRALTGVRMDVAAFVGVTPRGPARVPVMDEHWRDDRPCVEPDRPRHRSFPVAVESFDEYRRLYGGFEGPGLLPYAAAAFFEQGGRRAYIVRIVHAYGDDRDLEGGIALGNIAGFKSMVAVKARNEGAWGNALRTVLTFSARPLDFDRQSSTVTAIRLPGDAGLESGSLLRLTLSGGVRVFRFVSQIFEQKLATAAGSVLVGTLSRSLVGPAEFAEVIEGDLAIEELDRGSFTSRPLVFHSRTLTELVVATNVEVSAGSLLRLTLPGGIRVLRFVDSVSPASQAQQSLIFHTPAPGFAQEAEVLEPSVDAGAGPRGIERHQRLGLSPAHPRWMATVLCNESELVYPEASWIDRELEPERVLFESSVWRSKQFAGGEDRYSDIDAQDFFDSHWIGIADDPRDGVYSLAGCDDAALLVVPDLYAPPQPPLPQRVSVSSVAGAAFSRCVDIRPPGIPSNTRPELPGLLRNPKVPADLAFIIELQIRLLEFAETQKSFVVLLDVPPGLNQRKILEWRSRLHSSYAAAYSPWLKVARTDDGRDALISVPPSAVAAGIIACREITFGVPHGPANVIAAGVVNVDEALSPARHDELHPLGINVFLRERDGVRLSAARTLSRYPQYRQLNVRRLVTMIRKTLDRECQWMVFEPNNGALRSEVRHLLGGFLRSLYRAGAFKGAVEEEAFFVRCDETNNPPSIVDAGRLIAEIGIAPVEPIEFIVFHLARDADGTLTLEE